MKFFSIYWISTYCFRWNSLKRCTVYISLIACDFSDNSHHRRLKESTSNEILHLKRHFLYTGFKLTLKRNVSRFIKSFTLPRKKKKKNSIKSIHSKSSNCARELSSTNHYTVRAAVYKKRFATIMRHNLAWCSQQAR